MASGTGIRDNGAHWLVSDIEQFGHRSNGSLRGQKADIFEGGHRVPLIARWPGHIADGASSEETVALTDIIATVAGVIGRPIPPGAGEDSYSLLPLLLGEPYAIPLREATVHHSLSGMFAVRQGPWKLIEGLGSGGFTRPATIEPQPDGPKGQLYHLGRDPGETTDLYSDYPDIVARLGEILEHYRAEGRSTRVSGAVAER